MAIARSALLVEHCLSVQSTVRAIMAVLLSLAVLTAMAKKQDVIMVIICSVVIYVDEL